jgi:hypothetical protein
VWLFGVLAESPIDSSEDFGKTIRVQCERRGPLVAEEQTAKRVDGDINDSARQATARISERGQEVFGSGPGRTEKFGPVCFGISI